MASTRRLPVLISKLGPPLVPSHVITRARLLAPLLQGNWRLAVITGGAGTGKSMAAAQFCAALDGATPAWVSLDAHDDRPERFWLYFVTALETAVPGAFEGAMAQVRHARGGVAQLLTELVIEVSSLARPIVVVLDDFHSIRDADILQGIQFLVESSPAQLHLLINSRTEPGLPVARWRVREWTVEIRQGDLACSTVETSALLAALGETRLSLDDIDGLRTHTEGWVAALHLAALAMRGRDDAVTVAHNFTGRHRMIADLLMSEVLDVQSNDVQEFLLRTSLVEYVDGALADCLTGRRDGEATLGALADHISFVVPVDDQRTKYRYHPLLRDLLRLELERRHPGAALDLSRVAAAALEARGAVAEAVTLLLTVGDIDKAFELAFTTAYEQHDRGDLGATASWVDLFPQQFVSESIPRMLAYSFTVGACGRIDEAIAWIERTSHRLGREAEPAERDLRYLDALRLLTFTIAGAVDDGIECGTRAVAAVDAGLDLGTVGLRSRPNLARALLMVDQPSRAEAVLDEGALHDEVAATLLAPALRARIALREGWLDAARDHATRALAAAATLDMPTHIGALDATLAMAGVLVERDQLADAASVIARAKAISDHHPEAPTYRVLSRLDEVRWTVAQQGFDQGLVVVDEMREAIAVRSHEPLRRIIDPVAARLRVETGDLHRAQELIDRIEPGPTKTLLAARLDLALDRPERALHRLEGLSVDCPRDRLGRDLLLARAARASGSPAFDDHIADAVRLGAPQGYVRTFLEEGPQVRLAARRAAESLGTPAGVRLAIGLGAHQTGAPLGQAAVRLSDREQAVLRFLPTRMTNQEIASECYMSVNTVKSHLKSIYTKLAVSSRSEAVSQAQALSLLPV